MAATATLPSLDVLPDQLLREGINAERMWKRETLVPEDWLVPLSDACHAELDTVVKRLRTHPQPLQQLTPQMFSLPACTRVMAQVRRKLQQEIGFAVIDRLPVERYSTAENTALGWLMASLMGQVVAQKWDGTRLYDVKDSGKPLGYGVRRSVTNFEQDFHTDGGWLWVPPAFVGLFCLQPAQAGGYSRCANLLTVHNEMRLRHPDLLVRLYCPFWWDRQAEHGPGAPKFCGHSVYQYDGHTLLARYYEDYIKNGYNLAGETLDALGQAALAALRAIVDAPENWVECRLEKGQFQYINNRQLAHARTAFDNAKAPAEKHRHLVRLWNRDEGTPALEG
jgi:alpha-ketoglutarate-dependent taurine dioxygenase